MTAETAPPDTSPASGLVFLLDVDNTLLDNDRLKADLDQELQQILGPQRTERFWQLYEQVRTERKYVDYPRTVQLMANEYHDPDMGRRLQETLDAIPFRSYVYPHALEAIAHLKTLGTVVILSDGDPVFQPKKIRESGLEAAVDGHVIISVHKEEELATVFARYPARHYVIIDDKPRILSVLERECPAEFTTVLVLQGKYASADTFSPRPDFVVPHIGDVRGFSREQLTQPHGQEASCSPPLHRAGEGVLDKEGPQIAM
jgi:FMN phosphatase YigB (HAD superfamily)